MKTLSAKGLIGATLQMSTAAAAGQGIVLLLTPAITRLYHPSDFGVFSVYIGITVVDVLFCLGYERTIALPRNEKDAYALLTISLVLGVFFGLVTLAAIALFAPAISRIFGMPALAPLLWLLPVTMIVVAAFQALTNWAIRELDYTLLARVRVWMYVCVGLAQLLFGWFHLGAAGLIVGHLAGYVTAVAILLGPTIAASRRMRLPSIHESMTIARRFRNFPVYGATSTFLNSAGLQLPVLGMAILFNAEIAGWYGLAQRVFAAPLSIVALSLGQSLKASMAEAARKGELAVAIRGLLKVAALVQIGLSVILLAAITVAPWLFSLVFGETWRISGVYLQVMAPFFLVQFIVAPLQVVFDVLEQPHQHFIREALRILLLAGAFAWSRLAALNPTSTLMLISASGFLVYLASGVLVVLVCRRAVLGSSQYGNPR